MERHACGYCGHKTCKYCVTCYEKGRGKIGVCGRTSGRDICRDKHANFGEIKHGPWLRDPTNKGKYSKARQEYA